MFTPSIVSVGTITLLFGICKIIYLVLLIFNVNLLNFSHSAMLCSSVFIIYSVSGLFVPYVKDPSVLTREVSLAYVMNLKTVLCV